MKVLVVSSKYPQEYSGSGLRAHRSYLRLREKFGIDFEVICSSTETSEAAQYQLDGVSIDRVVSKRARNLNRKLAATPLRRLSNAVLSHIEARAVKRKLAQVSADVIHTFGYSPATAAAIKWSRYHRIPLVLEIVNPMATPYQYLPGARYFANQDLRQQSLIIAIGKSLGDMCKSHGLTDNVWVRPNPVDTSNFYIRSDQDRSLARKKISSATDNDILIIYVAKYITRKNHSFLLDVMVKLPDNFRLVLAGPPLTDQDLVPGLTADQIPTLEQRSIELGISERVEITHGFVDMAEYLSAADVFCFPAEREAMGTPVLESISSGVPVVANAGEPSFQEWVVDGKNGYLRPLEPGNWADAIIKASEFTADKRSAMSRDIKTAVSSDLIDEQYRKLLSAAASAKPHHLLVVKQVLSA